MIKNKELMELAKATHSGSTVTITPEEADKFLDYLVDQSVLKNNCRIVRMSKPEKLIDAIGYGSGRFLVSGTGFSDSDYKSQFASNQITLTTKKLRGCVVVSDDDKEDWPQENWTDVLMRLIAKKVANEIEEIAWISDTTALNAFASADARHQFDGWRFQITNSQDGEDYKNTITGSANILDASETTGAGPNNDFRIPGRISEYDASGEPPWEHKYHKMLKAIPSDLLKVGLKDWRFWNHPTITMDYLEALSGRQTALGDAAIMGNATPKYGVVPIVDAAGIAITLDADGVLGGGTYTDSLLTPAENLIMGIQRALKLEKYRDAANERDLWYFSMRADFQIENVNACVLTKNLVY